MLSRRDLVFALSGMFVGPVSSAPAETRGEIIIAHGVRVPPGYRVALRYPTDRDILVLRCRLLTEGEDQTG
jgi:hypothetical protein